MTEPRLRVLQLNAGTVLEPEWDRRRDEIVAWIRRLAPDVVCLEEIHASGTGPSTAHWIADELGAPWRAMFGGAPFGPGFSDDPALRFGSAVLSRFGAFRPWEWKETAELLANIITAQSNDLRTFSDPEKISALPDAPRHPAGRNTGCPCEYRRRRPTGHRSQSRSAAGHSG